ncbi:hypothetical protein BASA81_002594 [Batrachochytrium salamandrivorans]|nr:hypothetical protein BASA81_002594 [Batrachochytrium salamandrivorans]
MLQAKFRQALHRFPRLGSAAVGKGDEELTFSLSWPDFANNRRRQCVANSKNLNLFTFADKYDEYDPRVGAGELPPTVLCQSHSPSKRRLARLLQVEKQLSVEVYDHMQGKIASVPVTSAHGSFLIGEGISWHASENLFAYVADRIPAEHHTAFEFVEDWGEGYEGISQPKIFLFNVAKQAVTVALPDTVETAEFQPRFHPQQQHAVVLAYRCITPEQHNLKLGLLYCAQRPSQVRLAWLDDLKVKTNVLVSSNSSTADCPTFTDRGLVYLSSPPFTTHGGPMQITTCEVDWLDEKVHVPVHVTELNLFPSGPLTLQPLFNHKLWLSVFEQAVERIVVVDLQTGAIERHGEDGELCSRHLLAVSPTTGQVLELESDPSNAGTVLFGGEMVVQSPIPPVSIQYEVVDHPSTGCNSILILPPSASGRKKSPLIVCPHGGPHSAFSTAHSAEYNYLVEELGCALLLVNYRGSVGFKDPAALESLLGRVGELDVSDVMQAMDQVLHEHSTRLDEHRVGISGGSHGGFIAAHVSGQFPGRFRCAAMRNPVIDISTMFSTTDIPDWCQVEALGGEFHPERHMLHPSSLAVMREKSPIHHIANVKLPSLICLGAKDRRVPHQSQGLFYYRMLKMHQVPHVRLFLFPQDGHPIDKVTSAETLWAETAEFFQRHLPTDRQPKFQGAHFIL